MPARNYHVSSPSLLAVLALAVSMPVMAYITGRGMFGNTDEEAPIAVMPAPEYRDPKEFFAGISVQARAAYVLDVRTGETLYEKNSGAALPLASVTKIMTALVASRASGGSVTITERALAMSQEALEASEEEYAPQYMAVTVPLFNPSGDATVASSSPSDMSGTTTLGLSTTTMIVTLPPSREYIPEIKVGERWKIRDLLSYTLMVSSNEGANALALAGGGFFRRSAEESDEDAFVRAMIETARDLNLSSMKFVNPSGLDVNTSTNGGYGSAQDVARLFAHILEEEPEILDATANPRYSFQTEDGAYHVARNTNPLTATLPGVIASKTGFTNLAGGNLALALNVGPMRPIIIVVLGSTWDGRFTDVKLLADTATKAIAQYP